MNLLRRQIFRSTNMRKRGRDMATKVAKNLYKNTGVVGGLRNKTASGMLMNKLKSNVMKRVNKGPTAADMIRKGHQKDRIYPMEANGGKKLQFDKNKLIGTFKSRLIKR